MFIGNFLVLTKVRASDLLRKVNMVKSSPHPILEIPDRTVHDYILDRIKNYGDSVAMVDNTRKRSMTFREVRMQIIKCASALYKRGLRKGDVVAICATNRFEYPILLLAAAACGAAATTCNPLYQEGEILQQFKLSKPTMVFCEVDAFPRIENIAPDLPWLREVFTFDETPKSISYRTLVLNDDGKTFPTVAVDPNDLFILPYSSGTTGLPKGVMLSHRNLISQILLTQFLHYLTRSSCFCMVVPMFHTFGYSFTLYNLAVGSLNVFDSRFEMKRFLQAIQEYKVTHISAVPPIMIQMVQTKLLKNYDVSSLKRVITGAAPTALSLITLMQKMYNVNVTPSYGLTEMVPVALADPLVKKLDSVGTIAPNTTIKVVDPETGKELGSGQDGEILAKGPQMMVGYLENPEATAKTIDSNGWFHTGDIGHYDDDGMLYIVDRLKELIKYKGFQVAPAELEALLLTHPDVADAAVIGIPDSEAGELPKAFVVKKKSSLKESDIKKFVASKVSNYKQLKGGIQFMTSIPKSPSGKILRRELRKLPVVVSRI